MVARNSQFDLRSISEYLDGVQSDYRASKSSKFVSRLRGVSPSGSGADFHYRNERGWLHMMELARHYSRNNHIIKQGLRRFANNVIQGGFTLDPDTGDKEIDKDLLGMWDEWSTDPDQCHSEGEYDWHQMEVLGVKSLLSDGDFLELPRTNGTLQFVEAHRLRRPNRTKRNVIHGILLDEKTAKRMEYWVTKEDIDPFHSLQLVRDVERIPARNKQGEKQVFHIYDPDRFSQRRGITCVAPIADMVGMEDDIEFANLLKQQANSCITILREKQVAPPASPGRQKLGSQETETRSDGSNRIIEQLTPLLEVRGDPGETLTGHSHNVPNPTFFDHTALILTFIAINLDLPVQILLLDPTKTNFSGWRGALDQAKISWKVFQKRYASKKHRPVYRWKVQQFMARDRALRNAANKSGIDIFRHLWHFPIFPYIEPLKDTMADRERCDGLHTSRRKVMKERGLDIEKVDPEIIRDNVELIRGAMEAAQELAGTFPDIASPPDWREILRPFPADPAKAQILNNDSGGSQESETPQKTAVA